MTGTSLTAALIVAAGSGTRAGGALPKQYRPIAGTPMLRRAYDAVAAHAGIDVVLVVVSNDERDRAAAILPGAELVANRGKLADRLVAKPAPRPRAEAFDLQPNVLIDNRASNRFTVVEVHARDRPALLNRLAHALFQSKVTIHSAHVATYGERAVDVFYLTDLTGDRIVAPARLKTLEKRLLGAATGETMELAA